VADNPFGARLVQNIEHYLSASNENDQSWDANRNHLRNLIREGGCDKGNFISGKS
jgi:hypothetical protein